MDLTSMARDSVRTTGISHPSMEQALIDAVRDLAVKSAEIPIKKKQRPFSSTRR